MVLRTILAFLVLTGISTGVSAQQVEKNGNIYDIVEYSSLVSTNGAWGWEIDGPSIYNNRRVVVIGWLDAHSIGIRPTVTTRCKIYPHPSIKRPDDQNGLFTVDQAQVRLLWRDESGNVTSNRSLEQAEEACVDTIINGQISDVSEVLVYLFGVYQNGEGRRNIYCNTPSNNLRSGRSPEDAHYARGCNHLIVEHIEFAGIVRTQDELMQAGNNSLVSDLIRLGGERFLLRMIGR